MTYMYVQEEVVPPYRYTQGRQGGKDSDVLYVLYLKTEQEIRTKYLAFSEYLPLRGHTEQQLGTRSKL